MEITFENHTLSPLVLFSVDSMSKQERREGVVAPGVTNDFYVPGMLPGLELRLKDFNTGATTHTEVVTGPPRPLYSAAWQIGERGWDHYVGLNIRQGQLVISEYSGLWTYRSFRNPTDVSRTGPQKAQPKA